MTWQYNKEDFTDVPKGMEGFVYVITNLTNDKKYIGKKNFWTRQKDRKTGRRKTKESDWQKYFGSCDELIEDVKSELIDEPVVLVVLVTLIKPSTDAVSGGIEATPPSIIEFTRSNPSLIVVNSFG